MKAYRLILWLLLTVCTVPLSSGQIKKDEIWRSAEEAYKKGDIKTSASLFGQYLSAFPSSHSAMFNLGNCYLQEGDLGKAILWYERARKYRPHDSDILHNLAIAKSKMESPVVEIREFFAMRWIRSASGLFSVSVWGILNLGFFWITIGFCAKSIRRGNWGVQKWFAIAFACCFALALIFGIQRYHDLNRDEVAIVLLEEMFVNIAPDAGSKLVAKIGPGEKVVIVDSLGNYYKIRLANFEQGWISAEGVERI